METNYIVLFDYSDGEIIKIKLSESEKLKLEEYENLEDFLEKLEDKYNFRLSNCYWMSVEQLTERSCGM